LDEATVLVQEAVEIVHRTDEISQIGDAWADVAEVHRLSGRGDEAGTAAERAIEWYGRKGNAAAASMVEREFLST
jgi:hypothetical protein